MKLKSGTEREYAEYKANNKDPYGARVVSYGEDWANLMESRMGSGEKIADIAKPTSHEADTDGITGFMYGCAVQALAHFWEHGEALRLWHNIDTQIKDEGEKANESGGVLNPAMLRIGK
jgi:hypothetical protein